jgi:hypothetical protein
MPLFTLVLLGAVLAASAPPAASAEPGPWGYVVGQTRSPQQANFCDTRAAALEIAKVFERFGARTGFSALANSPDCSLRVHGLTPRALLHRVAIALESGDSYAVNFIEVEIDDGSRPVLVTTRTLTGAVAR